MNFPTIKRVFPSLIAQDIVDIQPMTKPFLKKIEYRWSIKGYAHQWMLIREEIHSVFSLLSPMPVCRIFDAEHEAIEAMVLEKLEF